MEQEEKLLFFNSKQWFSLILDCKSLSEEVHCLEAANLKEMISRYDIYWGHEIIKNIQDLAKELVEKKYLSLFKNYKERFHNRALHFLEKSLQSILFPNTIGARFSILMGMNEISPFDTRLYIGTDHIKDYYLTCTQVNGEAKSRTGRVKSLVFQSVTEGGKTKIVWCDFDDDGTDYGIEGYFTHSSGLMVTPPCAKYVFRFFFGKSLYL